MVKAFFRWTTLLLVKANPYLKRDDKLFIDDALRHSGKKTAFINDFMGIHSAELLTMDAIKDLLAKMKNPHTNMALRVKEKDEVLGFMENDLQGFVDSVTHDILH